MKKGMLFAVAVTKSLYLFAQLPGDSLASGALQQPEDEGLPWFYIILVLALIGLFFFLRRSGKRTSQRRA